MLARVTLINPLISPAMIAMLEQGPGRHQQPSLTGHLRPLAGENTQRLTAPVRGSVVYGGESLRNGARGLIIEHHSSKKGRTVRPITRAASGDFEWIFPTRWNQRPLSTMTIHVIISKCSGESFQAPRQKSVKNTARNEDDCNVYRSLEITISSYLISTSHRTIFSHYPTGFAINNDSITTYEPHAEYELHLQRVISALDMTRYD